LPRLSFGQRSICRTGQAGTVSRWRKPALRLPRNSDRFTGSITWMIRSRHSDQPRLRAPDRAVPPGLAAERSDRATAPSDPVDSIPLRMVFPFWVAVPVCSSAASLRATSAIAGHGQPVAARGPDGGETPPPARNTRARHGVARPVEYRSDPRRLPLLFLVHASHSAEGSSLRAASAIFEDRFDAVADGIGPPSFRPR